VVTLDIALTGAEDEREGIDLIGRILDLDPTIKIVMITAHGQQENALLCLERGAYDFFPKPIDLEQLRVVINRGIYLHHLEGENRRLQTELTARDRFEDIIGTSDKMRQVFDFIKTVAASDYTVLITGESGTGKELVARAIHRNSNRKDDPFVPINCGAIPENLLESELFGHEKGSFTDAVTQKIGKFELANKGTVFLDEIGELSLKLQVKLLRFLEDRRIERIGGTKPIALELRILAATNRRLQEEVAGGSFREDLFYRLSVLHIHLPRQAIDDHPWPGNVRELENKIKRAVILSQQKTISAADLGLVSPGEPGPELKTLQDIREHAEKECIKKALVAHDWNISKVSRQLQTSRTTLYELIEKYRLKTEQKG
jgi:two-component system NtrC family response regulator